MFDSPQGVITILEVSTWK